ncbi:MAG: DUF2281 domain-containing protein [Methylococcaceae bacterium]|nr:DUF2281 domain-containing protein [Methylococcaceae bacterium]
MLVNDKLLINELHQLPESLKLEALHYITFLKQQYLEKTTVVPTKKRTFGSAKGKYKLSEDFDAPLDDFKDYME